MPVAAGAQTITVIDQANVKPQSLCRVERAIEAQALQLRSAWGTPPITFAPGGWKVYVQVAAERYSTGSTTYPIEGEHYGTAEPGPLWREQPYAIVDTGRETYEAWAYAFSHETLEMLADPTCAVYARPGVLREVVDPVEKLTYPLDGVNVSDFVFPSYFADGPGPWDEIRALDAPAPPQTAR